MKSAKATAAFLLTVAMISTLSQVESVDLGETCHPLIPSLFCNSESNMRCELDATGAYKCACVVGHTSNKDNKACSGTYDEFCMYAEDQAVFNCNHDRGMTCSDTTVIGHGDCKCADRDNQIFSEASETCVGLSGASCDLGSTTPWERNCVANAFCDQNSQCKCADGFEEIPDRTCIRVNGGAGSSCTSNEDCDSNLLHLQCKENVCQCAEGYSPLIFNGTCVRDYGERCSTLDPCNEERILKCSSLSGYPGNCICNVPDWQMYMPSTKSCATIVGFECEGPDPWSSIDCVVNAECQPFDEATKLCQCKENFVATHNGLCRPVSFPELGDPCDTSIPYTCAADSHSICMSLGEEDETKGVCQCPANSSPNIANTRCYRKHGAVCMDSEEIYCNEDRHLLCSTLGTCSCNSSEHEFDSERDTCVGLVNAFCTTGNTEFDLPCVANAYCNYTENVGHQCTCNEGYEETVDQRCASPVQVSYVLE